MSDTSLPFQETLERATEYTTLIKWKICDFSKKAPCNNSKKRLRSGKFKLDTTNIACSLSFQPTADDKNDDKDYSAVYFYVEDFDSMPIVYLQYTLWLENEDGEKVGEREFEHDFIGPKPNSWGCGGFVHHDVLYSPDSDFMKDDIVYLCCKIMRGDKFPLLLSEEEFEFRQMLSEARKKGFTDDCRIEVDGKVIKLSKMILVAQSSVFEAMFTHKTIESQTGTVKIIGVGVEAAEEFVAYLHSGRIENMEKHAVELFKLGDKYDIENLQKRCSDYLVKSLTDENISERLILGFQHNDDDLKAATIKYIADPKNNKIFMKALGTEMWMNFSAKHVALAQEIMKGVTDKLFADKETA